MSQGPRTTRRRSVAAGEPEQVEPVPLELPPLAAAPPADAAPGAAEPALHHLVEAVEAAVVDQHAELAKELTVLKKKSAAQAKVIKSMAEKLRAEAPVAPRADSRGL